MKRLTALAIAATVASAPVLAQQQQGSIGPAPGRLVDIGGRKLHFICSGSGAPTVVLEAGAGAFAIDWSLVQPAVAQSQRVCSYDRAGAGWSDPRDAVDTPARIIRDLHSGLAAAGEKTPVVLVGHSMGGVYARLYQLEYPGDVVGLVLVDPSSEDGLFTLYQGKGVAIASLSSEQLQTTMPTAPVNVARRSPQTGSPFSLLPQALYELRVKLEQRVIEAIPLSVPAEVVREFQAGEHAALSRLLQSQKQADAPIARVPLVVLTRGDGNRTAHAILAKLSPNSRHTIVPGAAHEIQLTHPQVVIQAIDDVVAAARERKPLPPRP